MSMFSFFRPAGPRQRCVRARARRDGVPNYLKRGRNMLEGVVPFPPEFARRYREKGYWQDKSLAGEFSAVFRKYASRIAFVDRGKTYTYAEVDRGSDGLALNLLDFGLKPLDRVVVQLPNTIDFVLLYFA